MPQSRQLAAIMFTDIVGYTLLMGKNEQQAFELLNKSRQIQRPIIEEYQGRWIKEMGDGVMASFTTVSDAVLSAMKIQLACNASKEFQLRIGIHLGEVVFEDGDVFGDGVNIASRIQAIATPGSIFISEAVNNNVSNKKGISTEFVKTEKLKNVGEPVRIYQVTGEGIVTAPRVPGIENSKGKRKVPMLIFAIAIFVAAAFLLLKPLIGKQGNLDTSIVEKSIAVLPFADMSPQKDQEYLGNGLAEEIINSISIIKDLKVIGRTSAFQFRNKDFDAQAIGKKLGVNIVLEGSIQKSGNVLRIITQLIRVRDNSTIWSHRFDKELKDIFAIQDSIASKIVEMLKITLSESERPRLIKKETDPEVYSLYLKGLHTYKENNYEKSIEFNLRAIGIDSLYAPSYAYIALSKIWQINRANDYTDLIAIREAKEFANRAIQIDPTLAEGYSALALLAWTVELDFNAAKSNFERSIQLNPSSSLINNRYAYFLLWMGEFDKAETLGHNAISSDPADYNGYVIVATASMHKKKFREAEKFITEGLKLFPEHFHFQNLYIQNKFKSGDYATVIETVKKLLTVTPDKVNDNFLSLLAISYFRQGNEPESRRILQLMKDNPPKESMGIHYNLARIYAQYGMKDSCFLNLEKSLEKHEKDFRFLKIDPLFENVRQDKRYKELYRKYGFDKYK